MSPPLDWLSRLLDLVPVQGRLDLRCFYGAPWRIDQGSAAAGEFPYHVILSGTAVLEDDGGGMPQRLSAGDILVLPPGRAHVLHDGGGAAAIPAQERPRLNLIVSENDGPGGRLDMLCGHFVVATPHDRLLRSYLPPRLVVRTKTDETPPHESEAGEEEAERNGAAAQLAGLVALMRRESASDHLGGRAMLNALSTALFALILRLASEAAEAPMGLLALAGHRRLAPALAALFNEPGRPWTLPELARLCHMSRATLVRHFDETLGRSASDLLTDIRMTLAATELRKSSASTGAVAEAVGYQSEAAFQRAFKQHMGITPAAWRRATRSAEDTADSELS